MIIKKIISSVLSLGMIASIMTVVPNVKAEESLTKEVYVNVAQNKTCMDSATADSNTPSSNLLDGRFDTRTIFYGYGRTVTVDLGRRYNIEKIKLTAWDGGAGVVYVANSADGSDKVSVGSMHWSQDVTADLDGRKAYRYVLVQCSTGSWKELEVYAKQTVTEVSRGKSASASTEADNGLYSASLAVNGTNSNSLDAWVASNLGYHWWQVDLEDPEHIGYVEIEGRVGDVDGVNVRRQIGIYGSNEHIDSETDVSQAWTVNGTRLSYLANGTTEQGAYPVNPFPAYSKDDSNAIYKVSLNDTKAYQYIIYKKEVVTSAAMGEFRAFVVNPKITETDINNGTVTILFSDEIDETTIENLAVTDASTDEVVQVNNLTVDGYTVRFDVPYNGDFNITTSAELKNVYGIGVAEQTIFVEAEDIYNGLPTYTRRYNVAQNKPYTVVLGTNGNADNFGYLLDGVDKGNRSDGTKNAVITVDLGRRYNIDRIYMNKCNGGGGTVYVGNEADGSDKISVGSIGWKNFDVSLDGTKGYRYVTISANGNGIDFYELYVYATHTVTEVSRNKPATASVAAGEIYTANLAVNGTNVNSADAWVATNDAYHWWQVNLERPMNIGYIEIEGRAGDADNPYADRMMFGIYGANEAVSSNVDTASAWTVSGQKLASMGNNNEYIVNPFPEYSAGDSNAMYRVGVNDTTAYQYVIYKKEYSQAAAIGEFRAFVVNPEVDAIDAENNKVTVEFSDELATSSVTLDKISVTDIDGTEYQISNLTADGYIVSFDVDDAPEWGVLNVGINRKVRNTMGVTMAADYEGNVSFGEGIYVENLAFDKTDLVAGETVTATAKVVSALTDAENLVMFVVVKNSDGEMVNVNLVRSDVSVNTPQEMAATVTLPIVVDGVTVEAYVWNNKTRETYCDKAILSKN